MAITKKLSDFPGKKTFDKLYASIPGSPLVKNIIVGVAAVAVAAVVVGTGALVVKAGIVGAIALAGAFKGFLAAGLLVKLGVLVGVAALWKGVSTAVGFAYRFNWNISDKAIEAQIKASRDNLYRPVGQAAGKLLGFIGCGFAPGAFVFAFSPATAVLIMQNLKQSVQEEMKNEMANLARLTAQSQAQVEMLKFYGSIRKHLKRPGTVEHEFAKKVLGAENLKKWGTQDDQPFVISDKLDEQIDEIKDSNTKNFLEGLKEGFEDGCQEAVMNINQSISEQMAAMKLAQSNQARGVVQGSF